MITFYLDTVPFIDDWSEPSACKILMSVLSCVEGGKVTYICMGKKHTTTNSLIFLLNIIRWDISTDHSRRSLETLSTCLLEKKKEMRYGCQNPPLLNIELSRIVLDELHLMLRVFDVLMRNLVWAMLSSSEKDIRLNRLLQAIHKCGVTFRVR